MRVKSPLLGPNQMAQNYPSNIAVGQNYSVYVNVGNHLGSLAYYIIYVKLGNQTDQLPNATLGTPSSLSPLYEYRFSIPDSENWMSLLNFSVYSATISGTNSQINTISSKPAILSKLFHFFSSKNLCRIILHKLGLVCT